MKRPAMMVAGTVLGAAAVMVLPQSSTPQQVALANNAGAPAQSARKTNATLRRRKTTPTATPKPASTTTTVLGSLATTQYGQLQVKLTVRNGRITHVGFTTFVANDGHSAGIDQSAAPILIHETIAAQSAQIQGVSGATYTSGAYEQSLQAAIDKAGLHA
jgi:uncharacterized protein with FMN-binding domain